MEQLKIRSNDRLFFTKVFKLSRRYEHMLFI